MSNSVTPWAIVHQASLSMEILPARILEWVAIPSFRGSSQPRDRTQVSCIAGRCFILWATREARYIYEQDSIWSKTPFDSLWPHGLHHIRLPCSSPSPRACSNSCPLSHWCHPNISSSVIPSSPSPPAFSFPQNVMQIYRVFFSPLCSLVLFDICHANSNFHSLTDVLILY